MEIVAIGQSQDTLARLISLKCRVKSAENGILGIHELLRDSPELAIIEIDMPHFNGFSLVKVLNILELNIPVVFTAESDRHRDKAKSLQNILDYVVHDDAATRFTDQLIEKVPNWRMDSS